MSDNNAGQSSFPSSATTQQCLEATSQQVFEVDISLPPAYILNWNKGTCTSTPLPTAASLRDQSHTRDDGGPHLTVIRGLPADFVGVLDDVEPAFLSAHVRRRRYRPGRRRGGIGEGRTEGNGARCAAFEYPELVRGWAGMDVSEDEPRKRDLVTKPALRVVRGEGDDDDGVAVMLCHASLWLGKAGDC
jgi:hypothetical protein